MMGDYAIRAATAGSSEPMFSDDLVKKNDENVIEVGGLIYPKGAMRKLNNLDSMVGYFTSTKAQRKRKKRERQNRKRGRR